MTGRLVRGSRLVLSLAFAVLAATVLAVGIAARVAPALGHEFFSIRSGSMEPSLPVGALAVVAREPQDATEGSAVAFRLQNGVVVTHRVVEVVEADGGRFYRTQGDANQKPDPSLVPESALIGPVRVSLPLLGFVLALLGMPIGVVTILSVAATLITAIWLLEELERVDEADGTAGTRVVLPPLGRER
ncbi:MAG TPA: signal peptidase I [Candidatus Limnocylindria bacterium]|nr:signal peptidase I [Candidatus Limnocylindria bacterium]